MRQALNYGPAHWADTHADDRPYVIGGQRMYAIGMMSGAPPRVGDEHLVGEMGGLWAHPFKALSSWRIDLREGGRRGLMLETVSFDGAFWRCTRAREGAGLRLTETEWIDEDQATFFLEAAVLNLSDRPRKLIVSLDVSPDLRPCWMGGALRGTCVAARSAREIAARSPTQAEIGVVALGAQALKSDFLLAPSASRTLRWVVAAAHSGGVRAARAQARLALRNWDARSRRKQRAYRAALAPLRPSGADSDVALACTLLNIKLLETRNAAGRYAMAGLPEYPNLFGCDLAYSVPGLCAAGRVDLAQASLRALAEVAGRQCGRVPHEVVPDGGVFNPGNTQETPQFVSAVHHVWTRLRTARHRAQWLREMLPICRAGMLNYVRGGFLSPNSKYPFYPHGNAMVEREGMLPLKLDTVCYSWRALKDLLAMSSAARGGLDASDATALETWRAHIESNFERDWWIERAGLYADSLGWDGTQQHDGHWTQAVPLETGLARPAHARRVLATIERDWLIADGLPHTQGAESSVWTLPTGVLALAAARLGRKALARRLLMNIASTLENGQLGLFEELIPRGLCFVQLWSAAQFVEIAEALGLSALETRR